MYLSGDFFHSFDLFYSTFVSVLQWFSHSFITSLNMFLSPDLVFYSCHFENHFIKIYENSYRDLVGISLHLFINEDD